MLFLVLVLFGVWCLLFSVDLVLVKMFFCEECGENFLCSLLKLFFFGFLVFGERVVVGEKLNGFWFFLKEFRLFLFFLVLLCFVVYFLLCKLLLCGRIFGLDFLCGMGWGGWSCWVGLFLIFLGFFGIVDMVEGWRVLIVLNIDVWVVFGDGGEKGGVKIDFDINDILLEVVFFLFFVLLGFIVVVDSV